VPTYRLDLAYDGSGFHGYARQPDVRTVQGELEAALEPWTGGVATFVAGRTDKGVHASHQVVSFTCDDLETDRVVRSLNRRLAPEVAVRELREVAPGFHARFSATGRAYRYRILNTPVHDPFRAAVVWTFADPLDADAMHAAVQCLVGERDFAGFCRKQGDRSTTRSVEWAAWRRRDDLVELSIGASSFCHQMVRSIVAVSVEIGRARLPVAAMAEILASRDRRSGRGAAPPGGLTLVAVSYGADVLPRPAWVAETS
jgi:tRNA pseudouridine38-40 synthase